VAVEALSKHIRNLICREAKDKNFRTTRHFSPGYGDRDINQQKEIFKIISTHQIKVSLTKSGMMNSRKFCPGP
jgi:cobalamin-dependent methionine synthase I